MEEKSVEFKKALDSLNFLKNFSNANKIEPSSLVNEYKEKDNKEEIIRRVKNSLEIINEHLFSNYYALENEEKDYLVVKNETSSILEDVEDSIKNLEELDKEFNVLPETKEYKRFTKIREKVNSLISEENYSQEDVKEDESLLKKNFFHNLSEVKKDEHYELFYMKDEEGNRFYSEALSSVICKNEKKYSDIEKDDPLIKTSLWNQIYKNEISKFILNSLKEEISYFYKIAIKNIKDETIACLHSAMMALMLSKGQSDFVSLSSLKSCVAYYKDFLFFLRKLILLELEKDQSCTFIEGKNLFDKLVKNIFLIKKFPQEVVSDLSVRIQNENVTFKKNEKGVIGKTILHIYNFLHKLFSKYPNGPVFKAIDILINQEYKSFDPLLIGSFPYVSGNIVLSSKKQTKVICSPVPVIQESISYAKISPEFLKFILLSIEENKKILFFHIENRMGRKGKARARIFEELTDRADFFNTIQVISNAEPLDYLSNIERKCKDVDSYDEFVKIFIYDLKNSKKSSFFSSNKNLQEFINNTETMLSLCNRIKEEFFPTKKIFFDSDKSFFLDIMTYIFLIKNLEDYNPDYLFLVSKDGLDYVATFNLGMFSLINHLKEDIDLKKIVKDFFALLSPTLMVRDRLVFSFKVESLSRWLNSLSKLRENFFSLFRDYFISVPLKANFFIPKVEKEKD